jgi:flagellar biogenesis protein FliO
MWPCLAQNRCQKWFPAKNFPMKRFVLLFVTMLALVSIPHVWTKLARTLASMGGDLPAESATAAICPDDPPGEKSAEASIGTSVPDLQKSALRMGLYVAILAALGGGIVLLKRRGGLFRLGKKGSSIAIRDTLHLAPRNYLAVVEWENQRFLVGITAQGVTPIGSQGTKTGHGEQKKASLEEKSE